MLVVSICVASLLIFPLLLQTLCPYFWKDAFYLVKLINISKTYILRRRRRPIFLFLDRFLEQAVARPDATFIVFEDERFSYRDADTTSNRIANALLRHPQYHAGDTVALFMGNEPAFMFICLALAKLGSPAALLNHNIRSRSLLHCFSCSSATVLIAASELQDAVGEVLSSLREQRVTVLLMARDCDVSGMESFSSEVEQASDAPLPRALRSHVTFKSPAVLIYTSGTTGLPKAAVVNQNRLLMALAVLASNGVTASDVIYLNLPLYHTAGFLVGFVGAVETGSCILLRRKFSASQFWVDCRRHKVTVIQYIGEVLRYLCNTPTRPDDRDHCVRLAIGNGLRADVWTDFLRRFGNIGVREFYASTEGNVGFLNYTGKIGAIGRTNFLQHKLFPYSLVKYDTERDEPRRDARGLCIEAVKGETGLLVSKITERAPFIGYVGNEEQTEKKRLRDVLRPGDLYFNSGDLLRLDLEGFLYFQDRVGDTFRWKGENVATTEVADALSLAGCVRDSNVYGVEVPGHEGRVGMAVLTLREGAPFEGGLVYQQVVGLPSYARPRFIRIQTEVEVTSTFKQLKRRLVEEGFDPESIADPLYVLDEAAQSYSPLTPRVYSLLSSGGIKL
ncbi:long-chain fatty acid transport protein 2 [Gadus macrocephalus]|uniref:long-chain fatty acid transport protein 2 n=1 Tax=Gadus macrocephalus TaxID=80720 RepID=UPI0028CB7908|nr:long-chain fatty acid transport protein 2 [Gadus macrocephalus]